MTEPAEAGRITHTHIGGQAVIEGVMMRGKVNWAVAVRRPAGDIYLEEHDLQTAVSKRPWLGKPVVRGVVALWETLSLAMKAFAVSAEQAAETEEEKLGSTAIGFTMLLGVALAIGIFIVLPALATNLVVGGADERPLAWNVVDGVLRIVAFVGYIALISRMRDIQRVFAYHGAEHKTIHAFEHGIPLETESIQRFRTSHVRCGTSFLLMVMVIALIVYSLVPIKSILAGLGAEGRIASTALAVAVRLLFLPVIAGLAYEAVKLAGRNPDRPWVKLLLWPGMQLQRMTTREPEDSMIEVAVVAMRAVAEREIGASSIHDRRETPSAGSPPPERRGGTSPALCGCRQCLGKRRRPPALALLWFRQAGSPPDGALPAHVAVR